MFDSQIVCVNPAGLRPDSVMVSCAAPHFEGSA